MRNIKIIASLVIVAGLIFWSKRYWSGASANEGLSGDTTLSLVVQEWSKRVEKYPENDEYRYKRGLELAKDRKLDLALADMNKAIELSPLNGAYYVARADVYMAKDETKNALADFEKAVEVEPRNEKALTSLGQFYLFVRQFDNSLKVFKKLETVNPSNTDAHFYQGMTLKEAGDTAAAIDAFKAATQVDLFHYNSLIQLGQLYSEMNDGLGLSYFRNAALADEFSDEAYYGLGLLHQKLGNYDSAIANYQRTIDANAQHYFAYYNTGYIMFGRENWDRAIEHFRIAVKFAPEFAKGHYMLGLSNEGKGLLDQAAVHYERCLQADPNFELAKEGLKRVKP
ncbi:MAG: tetratricopeptide repeat protein [Bacteroidia bacterium]|nr:tetratricopeptide repeat protein [Bacteroidia bacterium]